MQLVVFVLFLAAFTANAQKAGQPGSRHRADSTQAQKSVNVSTAGERVRVKPVKVVPDTPGHTSGERRHK